MLRILSACSLLLTTFEQRFFALTFGGGGSAFRAMRMLSAYTIGGASRCERPADLLGCTSACARFRFDAVRTPPRHLRPRRSHAARPARLCPTRSPQRLDGSEIFLKLETLQPIGSFKIRGAHNAVRQLTRRRAARRRLDGQRRQRRAGRGARRAARRRALLGHGDGHRAAGEARRDPAARRDDRSGHLRRVLAHGRSASLAAHARPLRASLRRRPVHRRQRHARARDPRGPARRRCGRRRRSAAAGCSSGVGSAMRALQAGGADHRRRAGNRGAAVGVAARRVAPAASTAGSASFVDGAGGKSVLPTMWPLLSRLVDESDRRAAGGRARRR